MAAKQPPSACVGPPPQMLGILLGLVAISAILYFLKDQIGGWHFSRSPAGRSPVPARTAGPESGEECREGIKTAYWNSWVGREDSSETIGEDPEGGLRLPEGTDYVFRFDLSAYEYARTFAESAASAEAGEQLMSQVERASEKLTAFVHPVITGRGLRFAPNQAGTRDLTIDVCRLRRPPAGRDRREGLRSFADRVQAGRVEMRLQAFEPGCAAIGISIWNKDLNIPLDYLVRRVTVTDAAGKAPECRSAAEARGGGSFRASLLSLLEQSGGLPADAALHIFEMQPGFADPVRSVAVFLEKGGPAYAWTLRERLSTFTTSSDGLVSELQTARRRQDYGPVAKRLEKTVFDGESEDDKGKAREALRRLRALANAEGQKRGVFFARLVDLQGTSLFLPLGLLPGSPSQFLGAAVDLVQPLPRESYAPAATCVRSWTLVLPKRLGETVDEAYFQPVDAVGLSNRIENWNDFASYLESDASPTPSSAEGMLLLAHHSGGNVWFVRDEGSLRFSDVTRRYAPGSAVLLVMCGAGALTGEQPLAFLKQLNSLGVDAAIVSPFAISTPFGVRVAMHFASQIERARREKARLTVLELLRRTTASIRGDDLVGGQGDGVFEFLLAGNGGLEICFEEN